MQSSFFHQPVQLQIYAFIFISQFYFKFTMMNGALQEIPDFQTTRISSIQPFMANVVEMFNLNAPNSHTRFYGSMVHKNKNFRLAAVRQSL